MSGGEGGGGPPPPRPVARRDPYAVLNLGRRRSRRGGAAAVKDEAVAIGDDEVREAYRRLSRCFHPDKRPVGKERDDAQETFLELVNAYNILLDPALRQAYDDHGHGGVTFVRHRADQPDSLHRALTELHEAGDASAARAVLDRAVDARRRDARRKDLRVEASIELRSSWDPEPPWRLPEVRATDVSISAAVPPTGGGGGGAGRGGATPGPGPPVALAFGGESSVEIGEGEVGGVLSASYEAADDTQISMGVGLGTGRGKVTLRTSRVMTNGTGVTAGVTAVAGSPAVAFSFSSHRSLFDRTVFARHAAGLGSNLELHYGLMSFTTLFKGYPRCTAEMRVKNRFPFALKLEHDLDGGDDNDGSGRSGKLSVAWSPRAGWKVGGSMTRMASQLSNWTVGLQHVAMDGLTWSFRLKREGITVSVPISVYTVTSPGYAQKVLFLSSVSLLIDEVVGEAIRRAQWGIGLKNDGDSDGNGDANAMLAAEVDDKIDAVRNEARWMTSEAAREDASRQTLMMGFTASRKREREEDINGLVILQATYYVTTADAEVPSSLDVTMQLQFWVKDSSLRLPSTSKSRLLGFYDVRHRQSVRGKEEDSAASGWTDLCRAWLSRFFFLGAGFDSERNGGSVSRRRRSDDDVRLTVRYKIGGYVYEITVDDNAALDLPSAGALTLGPSSNVL